MWVIDTGHWTWEDILSPILDPCFKKKQQALKAA